MRQGKILIYFLILPLLFNACNNEPIDDNAQVNTSTLYIESTYNTECNGNTLTVTDVTVLDRGEGTGTTTWTNNKTYILEGLVYVNKGQTLTIEPGTVIKAKTGRGQHISALIVARGGKIIAKGTADAPIVFTTDVDNIYSSPGGYCDESALTASSKGLWGGIVILGNSSISTETGEARLPGLLQKEKRAVYGGDDYEDNSGILQYVSIRHAGAEYLNNYDGAGLILAGVGSKTQIDHIEIYASQDDGLQIYGGMVNTRYIVSAYSADDGLDYTEGWRGQNQYWLIYQSKNGDCGIESDGRGKELCSFCSPYSVPFILNATVIGNGARSVASFKHNGGGEFFNSVFLNFKNGIDINYDGSEVDAYTRWTQKDLIVKSNIMDEIPLPLFALDNNSSGDASAIADSLNTALSDLNYYGDPGIENLVPVVGSKADQAGHQFTELGIIQNEDYKGAFKTGSSPWFIGWTKLGKEF